MPNFPNLPGIYVKRLDGGLRVSLTDEAPVILLLGYADVGPGDAPFLARDTSKARATFGGSSELYQGLVETRRAYGEGANIFLFRIGTSPGILTISGSNAEEVKVVPVDRNELIGSDWKVSFDGSENTLWVYNADGQLVFSNTVNNRVDNGTVEIRGELTALSGAQSFGDPSTGTLAGSVPMGSGVFTSGAVFTAATVGCPSTNLKCRYEALQDAYRLLDSEQLDIVVPLSTFADDANVASFISGVGGREYPKKPWDSKDNPLVFGSGVLGWFKETAPTQASADGSYSYQWANDIVPSGAAIIDSPNYWDSATDRVAAEFHEVSFAYQLANFCYQHTKNEASCIGVIGFKAPKSYFKGDLHQWAGEPPTRSATGAITTDGFGLAGFPETVGATAARLNPLCTDKSTGRDPGFFATDSEQKDDFALTDEGGFPIDIGAFLSLAGESPEHLNSMVGTAGYTAGIAAYYAGLIARLDEKTAPTNQEVAGLRVPYRLGKRRLDNLVASKMVMLTQRRDGVFVVDAPTAATDASDYRRLATVRIVTLVEKRVRAIGRKYIGQVVNNLLREALKSDIEEGLQNLVIRGYLKRYTFDLEATQLEDILGKMNVKLVLAVPNELRQIFVTTSLSVE